MLDKEESCHTHVLLCALQRAGWFWRQLLDVLLVSLFSWFPWFPGFLGFLVSMVSWFPGSRGSERPSGHTDTLESCEVPEVKTTQFYT